MIVIDPNSHVPPFEQIRAHFVEAAAAGDLVAGVRLPTVRRLAEDLGLPQGTIARAYHELEVEGFIETRGRNGIYFAPQGDAAQQQAQRAASAFAEQIRALRLDTDEALAIAAAALRPSGDATLTK